MVAARSNGSCNHPFTDYTCEVECRQEAGTDMLQVLCSAQVLINGGRGRPGYTGQVLRLHVL